MATITRKRAGEVEVGDLVLEVDDDSLETDEEINANYNADEMRSEAAQVLSTGGHADIGWLELDHPYLGIIKARGDWDQYVWVYKP